jgi:hypothetical protein
MLKTLLPYLIYVKRNSLVVWELISTIVEKGGNYGMTEGQHGRYVTNF